MDWSNGYESHALEYASLREERPVGALIVKDWASSLNRGAEVLEIGCGAGFPVSTTLVTAGLNLWAVDASATLLKMFQSRLPRVPARCEPAQTSDFFGQRYDAAISIGLLFLFEESAQHDVIRRVSDALRPGGRFLFTAPIESGTWKDRVTGLESLSLGREKYESALSACGLRIIDTYRDEGANDHYDAEKVRVD